MAEAAGVNGRVSGNTVVAPAVEKADAAGVRRKIHGAAGIELLGSRFCRCPPQANTSSSTAPFFIHDGFDYSAAPPVMVADLSRLRRERGAVSYTLTTHDIRAA